jgi:hypothetical protein
MLVRWLALLALLLSAPALADSSAYPTLEGSWALEAGGTTIFRFDLARGEDGKWRGTWSKPSEFASDGNTFSRLSGPAKKATSMTALETPNGIELSFDDPTPGAVPDIFDFKPIDDDAVEMMYVGTDLAPYVLERVKADTPIGPWDRGKTYSRKAPPATGDAPKIEPAQVLAEPTAGESATPARRPSPDPGAFKLKPGAPVGR